MRKFFIAAAALAVVTVSFAAPSQAGGYYGHNNGYHNGGHYGHHKHKKHHKQYYNNDYSYNYRPTCRHKNIKVNDGYGYYHYETIKVCR